MNIPTVAKRVGRDGYVEGIGRMSLVVLLKAALLMSFLAANNAMNEADAAVLDSSLMLNVWFVEVSVFAPMMWVAMTWAMLPVVQQIGSDFEAELEQFDHRHLIGIVALSLGGGLLISRGIVLPYIMRTMLL